MKIPDNVLSIIERLTSNDFEGYIVGGYVRDLLSGKKSKDIDVATDATPDDIQRIFQNVKLVGKSFGVCVVDNVEIATFRKDRYFGLSDKNVEICFSKSIEEDLCRRDFTINAIAYSPQKNKIVDLFNGQLDLKNKLVRFVGNANDRIYEDPNRIIRACRFASRLEGQLESNTKQALIRNSSLVEKVSKERIRLEVIKSMSNRSASMFFTTLKCIGVLKYVFPSLEKCFGEDGGPYHSESIWDHCLLCGNYLPSKNPLLKLTGYIHDIGKPVSKNFKEDNTFNFRHHDSIGSDVAREELKNLTFSNDEIDFICFLIQSHMRISSSLGPPGIRRLLRDIEKSNSGITYRDLFLLYLADSKANLSKQPKEISDIKKMLRLFNPVKEEKLKLEINGNDVMKIFNIPQGKKVGEILQVLEDLVIKDSSNNDREKLINFSKYLSELENYES